MHLIWDEAKRERNLLPEPEGLAIGWLDDHLRTLVFTPLGTETVSAISLRPASRKERILHDEA